MKYGDRYFYETGNDYYVRFTPDQLYQIRKASMSRVICENSDIEYLQKNAFRRENYQTNPLINCDYLDELSLEAWRETPNNYNNYNYNNNNYY